MTDIEVIKSSKAVKVSQATLQGDNKPVVLKQFYHHHLPPSSSSSEPPPPVVLLGHQLHVLAYQLGHPHLVSLYGVSSHTQGVVDTLIMEHMSRGSLESVLGLLRHGGVGGGGINKEGEEMKRLRLCRFRVLNDVCLGMSFLHHHGVIHGQLNTSHILLDDDGHAKVLLIGSIS